ncbi:hypothetical protein [Thalassomonas haliotis]|uniref:Uncharacterized protein n=1 Tax=Thalassomonas haliotis TaxID=485448 RepID=A0ABY7V845_9GAMM|nr:hypothetical protein [Thalassomonas haliotis]WDE09547.1 hypothetical protein H3N35_14495 [Thalassomonas haliotis]
MANNHQSSSSLTAKELQRQYQIADLLTANQHTFIQMSSQEFIELVLSIKKLQGLTDLQAMDWLVLRLNDAHFNQHWQEQRSTFKGLSSYIPVTLDVKALTALAAEMQRSGNMFSKYQVKTYSGKAHIIFKGYPALRQHLTGTRYLASNPKVIQLGVGKLGAMSSIKGGFIISLIVSAAFHSIEQLLDEEKTWHYFVAGISVDASIALGSTAIAGALVSMAVGTATMVTIGPLIAVVLIGSMIAYGANVLIDTNKLTLQFAHLLRQAETNFNGNISSVKNKINQIHKQSNEDPLGFMQRLFAIPQFRGL